MDPLSSSARPPRKSRSVLASVLGCLAGLAVSVAASVVLITFGLLDFGLAASPSATLKCDRGILTAGVGLTVASIAVAVVAWCLLVRYRKAEGWWIAFSRGFTTIVALFMLAPWPCGLTFSAAFLLSTCRPH